MFCYKLQYRLLVFESHIVLAGVFWQSANDCREQTFNLDSGELQSSIIPCFELFTALDRLLVQFFCSLRPVRCHVQQFNHQAVRIYLVTSLRSWALLQVSPRSTYSWLPFVSAHLFYAGLCIITCVLSSSCTHQFIGVFIDIIQLDIAYSFFS